MRSIAILTGPEAYLDHLGIFSHLMGIPLIVTDIQTYQTAKEFYPQIEVILKGMDELSLDFLANNFDVIFETGKFWSAELLTALQCMYKKQMRCVYCPHGNSDKGHSAQAHIEQDISLIYGDHMFDLLGRTGALSKIRATARTGNYRALFYLEHRNFYDKLVENQIKSRLDCTKKTILYAPTWEDGENPTSFFTKTQLVVEQLAGEWNVMIKLHPFLAEQYPAQTYHIIGLYEKHPKVLFLERFPAIYPLLQCSDVYLGDYSSIGYDYLFFDRPLYFFQGAQRCSSINALHPCGLLVPDDKHIDLFIKETLEKNQTDKQDIRRKTFRYAFGEERPFAFVKEEILRVCKSKKASDKDYFTSLSAPVLPPLSPPLPLPQPQP